MRECTYRTDGGDILLTDRLCEIENVNGRGGGDGGGGMDRYTELFGDS